jgi:predicted transcriptional regulator
MAGHKMAMSFFVSSDIVRLLDEMANQERRNRSQMVRELVLREADRRGLKVEVVPEVEEVRHG